jgi:hypothetical protein
MPQRDAADFDGQDCIRVYIAGRLAESRRVERILDGQDLDYFVEVESFRKMLLGVLPREYSGAAFYVRVVDFEAAHRALLTAGLRAGLTESIESETPEPSDPTRPPAT